MWSQLALCLFVGLAYASSNPGWKDNAEYVYMVRGRTLASLHEVSNQYSGIIFKAKLRIQPKADGKLQGQISDAQYSQVHTHLQQWDTHMPDAELSWKTLELSKEPFQVEMKAGVITDVIVNKDISNWEANLIRSILSQFQLNTSESNAGRASSSHPNSAVYTTMEDTVTGNVETSYKINPLPEYLVSSEPWGQHALELKGDGQVIEIMKHKNYTNSFELPVYSHGFGDTFDDLPGTNSMGSYLVRDATSRVIVSGSLKKYTIQHSYTVNKIMVNPTLQDTQKGSVHSLMNVTLEQMKNVDQPITSVSQPIRLGNLVYSYGSPLAHEDRVHEKNSYQQQMKFSRNEINQKTRMMRGFRWRRSIESQEDSNSVNQDNSEESYKKVHPLIEEAPETPLLPFSVGYGGLSIRKAANVVETVKSLSQEMANDLQGPKSNLQETLSKFTILGSLMRTLSAEEMQRAAGQLYSNDQEGPRRDAWQVFRDSVADCGTGPALLTIQNWIQTQKLGNSEAAVVFSTMVRSVRQPTLQYMKTAFELVKSNQVRSEWPLNTSALFGYSDLISKVYVPQFYNRKSQYPGKSFRNFDSEEGKKFLKESVIPFYSQQLQEAISRGETSKIHAYIMALGNIGHPDILHVYEDYLEGKKQASQYQRILMIISLNKLAINYPQQTRVVLFRVYQNTGEIEEVRVAAVLSLLCTLPKTEMLQYMASYTNVDVHEQVNAIVKNGIEQISQLPLEHLEEFRAAAESAKPLLTKKIYGMHYGASDFRRIYIKELGLSKMNEKLLYGSSETFMPKGFRYTSAQNLNGNYEYMWNIFGIVSSVEELIHVLKLQTQEYSKDMKQQNQNFEQQKQNQWSSQHIASLLKLNTNEREQLEGVFSAGFDEALNIVSFDNRTIEHITREFGRYEQELKQGKKINYIKLLNNAPLALSFPTEMGLPFLFTRESPTLIRAKGSFEAKSNPQMYQDNKIRKPEVVEIKSDMSVTFSGKRQGQLSFVTPFDHHQYIAGYDKHWQVFVPVSGDIEINVREGQIKAEIKPCNDKRDSSLLQYATQPYTSRIDITKFKPISAQPNTHPIEQPNLRGFDVIIGEKETGLALRVQMRHERQHLTTPKMMKLLREGPLDGLMGLWNDAEIQQSQFNISHVVPKSTTRKIIIRLGRQEEYYKSGESSMQRNTVSETPQERQKEAMKKAAAAIKSVTSQVYDASFEFQGEKTIEYRVTGAFAKSNVDPKSRILVEYRKKSDKQDVKPYLVSFEAKNEVPNTNGLDLEYSMQNEPKVDSEIKLVFGENEQSASTIHTFWQFRRSSERKEFLREQPFYRQCQQEQREGNKQTPACINMTIESNFLDRVSTQVETKNLKPEWEEFFKTIYYELRFEHLPDVEVESRERSDEKNQYKMDAAFDPDLGSVNVSVKTPQEKVLWKNLGVDEWTKQVAVLHPVYHLRARLVGKALRIPSYRTSCVVDRSQIKTFNNWTFPSDISKQWTVMVQYVPNEARHQQPQNKMEDQLKNQVENYAILVRKNTQNGEKKDVKVTLSTPESDFKVIDVTMTPEQSGNIKAKVTVNGQLVQVNDKESYDIKKGYIQIYSLPNGEIKVEVRDAFYAIYDGERIRVVATNFKLKNANRGICGQFTNSKFEDFVTPPECYVSDVNKFVKSYETEGQEGQKIRQELSRNDKECAYKNIPLYVNVLNSEEEHSPGKCSFFQTRYIEQNDEICFTTRSMPACKSGCQPQGTVTKDVPVHCIRNTPVAQLWKNQIDRGANPDFSHKKETRSVPMQLPQSCAE